MLCLAPRPLSLVLQIVVRDFEAVFSESQKDLIADRHAVIGVATTQLLEHSFGDLGRQGDFRRTPADRRRRQLKVGGPFRDRVQIRHPHPALPDALDKVVMGFELLRTSKTGVVGIGRSRLRAWFDGRRWRQVGCLQLWAGPRSRHVFSHAAAAAGEIALMSVIISSKRAMKFFAAFDPRSCRWGMWVV